MTDRIKHLHKKYLESLNTEESSVVQNLGDLGFELATIAYLRENNETVDLLNKNQECFDEFKTYLIHLLKHGDHSIQEVLKRCTAKA